MSTQLDVSAAASLLGSIKSETKSAASRINGAKGGRPRLPRASCDRCGREFVQRFGIYSNALCARCR